MTRPTLLVDTRNESGFEGCWTNILEEETIKNTLKSKTSSLTAEVSQQSIYISHKAEKRFWLRLCLPPVPASFSRQRPQAAPRMERLDLSRYKHYDLIVSKIEGLG